MMSTDADRAQNLVSQVNYLFFTPLSFGFALYLLIWNVGTAACEASEDSTLMSRFVSIECGQFLNGYLPTQTRRWS